MLALSKIDCALQFLFLLILTIILLITFHFAIKVFFFNVIPKYFISFNLFIQCDPHSLYCSFLVFYPFIDFFKFCLSSFYFIYLFYAVLIFILFIAIFLSFS
jgi:hypothetical protein